MELDCVRSFQDDKNEGKIVDEVCVRSFQDDKNEGKIVEVDCGSVLCEILSG